MAKSLFVIIAALFVCGCKGPGEKLAALTDDFNQQTLAMSPSTATGAGFHRYKDINLDEKLDDVSALSFDKQRQLFQKFQTRLKKEINPEKLDAEGKADYTILQYQIELGLLELTEIQSFLHNPTLYIEILGNALFQPYVLEYAPKEQRFKAITERLKQVPLFLDNAKSNLADSTTLWTNVAIDENAGNIDLIKNKIRRDVPPELLSAYAAAERPALDALEKFQAFLKIGLSARSTASFRLGRSRYTRKFHLALGTDRNPEQVLGDADAMINRVRAKMLTLALPLHARDFPGHGDHDALDTEERQNTVVGEVLDRIAQRHSTPESYIQDAKNDLEEARQFVQQKNILTLPASGNLKVIETPEFMRGIYGVGGAVPAPVLEPQLGAFYWVTPISAKATKEEAESKLREYNFYKLKLLTIHEAMPGHYVQAEYANQVEPKSRRVLRSLYGNGPYVEGWAQYITAAMLQQGFLGDPPEMQLTFEKEALRVLANAVLDIRLHMLDMTDDEAMTLMQKRTFQEKAEATGKLQRAKLSSCQLPMYMLGWQDWALIRDMYKSVNPSSTLAELHQKALKEGAVPLPILARLLTGKDIDVKAKVEF